MSTTVDNRVVEMQFDNDNFESNVKQSMSTLEKLKESLNFDNAAKNFESLDASANDVSFDGLLSSVKSLEERFSTFGIIGMRVIENITDSMMELASKTVSFLTDSIVSGGITRAMNLENAHFMLQGLLSDEEAVEAVMQNVNDAVDGTAYSLDAAATVASQLVASGMEAGEEMYSSLRAVAGVAAMTNSEYSDIGKIFTTVAGNGRLMGDQLLQLSSRGLNAAATLADYLGTTEATVREMVSAGEIDFQTFANAMDDAFGEHAKAANETFTGSLSNIKSALARIGALFVSPLIEQNGVPVELFNTIRERINDIKENITPLADTFVDFVSKMATCLNSLLSTPLADLIEDLESLTGVSESTEEAIEAVTTATSDLGDVVDRVINGEFKNGQERIDALTEAGYDWAYVQNLVNEKLGDSTRHATDYEEATSDLEESEESLNETQQRTIEDLTKMSDEELINLGLTQDEVDAFRDLEKQSEKTGIPINELAEDMEQLSGKSLLFNSFKNIGQSLVKVFGALRDAWSDVFPASSEDRVYNLIAGFHKLTTYLTVNDEAADKIKRTFRGLLSILGLVSDIVKGGLKVGLSLLSGAVGDVNIDILDLTANIGDAIYNFRQWLNENDRLTNAIQTVGDTLASAAAKVKEYIKAFLDLPQVQSAIESLEDKLKELKEVGVNSIEGLKEGLEDGITSVPEILIKIGEKLLEKIREVLGIHSPSTKMYEIGTNIISGLVNGLSDGISTIVEKAKEVGSKILGAFSGIDWSTVVAGGVAVGLLLAVKKLTAVISALTDPYQKISAILFQVKRTVREFADVLESISFETKTEGIKNLAEAIGILVVAVIALTYYDPADLLTSVGIIALLGVVLAALAITISKIGGTSATINKSGAKVSSMVPSLLSLAASLVLVAAAIKLMGGLSVEEMAKGAAFAVAFVAFVAAICKVTTVSSDKQITNVSGMILKLTVALALMVVVVKLVAGLSEDAMVKGALFAAAFVAFVYAICLVTSVASNKQITDVSGMILKLTVALLLMVVVVKLVAGLSTEAMLKGAAFAEAFVIFVMQIVAITTIASDKQIANVGTMVLALSAALILLTVAVKLISGLSVAAIVKGIFFIEYFVIFLAQVVAVTKIASGEEIAKVGTTMLALSVSIGIMAMAVALLGLLSIPMLAKGVVAVSMLGVVMALMITAAKNAQDCKNTVIAMAAAIAVMAVAVAALSLIKPTKLAGATAALSILMAMFALIVKSSGDITTSYASLIIMALVVAELAAVLYLLAGLPIESTVASAASLSLFMLSMAATMQIISGVRSISAASLITLGVMVSVMTTLALVLSLLEGLPAESTLATAVALSTLMIALSAACVILSKAGTVSPGALTGVIEIMAVLTAIGALLGVIGGLTTMFPQMEEFLDKGIAMLEKLGYGLGNFLGSIIGGFGAGLTSGLPEMGEDLSAFFDSISGVDSSTLNSVKAVAESILVLSAAELVSGITSFISGFIGSSSMSSFGEQLKSFGEAMAAYCETISAANINVASVRASATAAEALAELSGNLPKSGGVLQDWLGTKDLAGFGEQIKTFGEALVAYSDVVSGNIDADSIEASANAAQSLSELEDSLPKTGGKLQDWLGEKDLADFGEKIKTFGDALATYSGSVSGKIDADAIQASADAASSLAELETNLPNTGGKLQDWLGQKDLGDFGSRIKEFGDALVDYSNTVSGNIDEEAVNASASAGQALSELESGLNKSGGVVSFFTGEKDIESFGNKLISFGGAIVDYSNSVSGIDADMLSATTAEFSKLLDLATGAACVDYSGLSGFAASLTTLGNTGVSGFAEAFTNASSKVTTAVNTMLTTVTNFINNKKQTFRQAGQGLTSKFVEGIKSWNTQPQRAFSNMIASALTSVRDYRSNFYSAGSYLVEGFASGISANTYKAVAQAKAMAKAAADAAAAELDEHSPSKVGYKIGDYFGVAFVNAIGEYADKAYSAGADMASSAQTGLSGAISKVMDILDSDLDFEPTITPVLDMSNIEEGSSRINAIFGRTQAMAISGSMSRASGSGIQNGDGTGSQGNVYNSFTQNNYSPKSLSRAEIYRQTKNQFSAFERKVER